MSSHRFTRIVAVVVLCVALLLGLARLVFVRAPWPARANIADMYPPNARQLIAAGLSFRSTSGSQDDRIAVDRVFVDTRATTVVFYVRHPRLLNIDADEPIITLSDDRGRVYQAFVQSFETGPIIPPNASGPAGMGWRVLAGFSGHMLAQGAATFAPLSASAHVAVLTISVRGHSPQIVRVPLRLAALRSTVTATLGATVRWHGIVLRLGRISRGLGSATLSYSADTIVPGGPPPMLGDRITGRGGHWYADISGHGGCGDRVAPASKLVPLHCDYSDTFAPPARGMPLLLTIHFDSGTTGRPLPGASVSIWFRVP